MAQLQLLSRMVNSDVIDSSSFYYTEHGDLRYSYRDKFMASHTLTIRPTKGLDIAMGESIIYSDELEYSLPDSDYIFPTGGSLLKQTK